MLRQLPSHSQQLTEVPLLKQPVLMEVELNHYLLTLQQQLLQNLLSIKARTYVNVRGSSGNRNKESRKGKSKGHFHKIRHIGCHVPCLWSFIAISHGHQSHGPNLCSCLHHDMETWHPGIYLWVVPLPLCHQIGQLPLSCGVHHVQNVN